MILGTKYNYLIPSKYAFSEDTESPDYGLSVSIGASTEVISNFLVIPQRRVQYIAPSGEITKSIVEFKLWIEGRETDAVHSYTLKEIEKLDFFELDNSCIVSPTRRSAHNEILYIMKVNLRNIETVNILVVDQLGWTVFNGNRCYVAGNRLITSMGFLPNSEYIVAENLASDFNFNINVNISEFDSIQYIHQLMRIEPSVSAMLVSNTITGLLRSSYSDAGVDPAFSIYLQSPPQHGKTTLAELTGLFYKKSSGKSSGLISLDSSSSTMQEDLSLFKDCAIVIDDLFDEKNQKNKTKREMSLIDIARIIGNNSPRQKKRGNQTIGYTPHCSVVFTAEYDLSGLSTLARCVILKLNSPLSKIRLFDAQNISLGLSTAVYFFLKWCASNYPKIVDSIRTAFNEFRRERSIVDNQNERIHENFFILRESMNIFWDYAADVGGLTSEEIVLSRQYMKTVAESVLVQQIQTLNQLHERNADIGSIIHQLVQQQKLYLKRGHHYNWDSDGVIIENVMCLHPERLTAVLNKSGYMYSERSLIQTLRNEGYLLMDVSGKSTKKIDGVRLLHIPLSKIYPN